MPGKPGALPTSNSGTPAPERFGALIRGVHGELSRAFRKCTEPESAHNRAADPFSAKNAARLSVIAVSRAAPWEDATMVKAWPIPPRSQGVVKKIVLALPPPNALPGPGGPDRTWGGAGPGQLAFFVPVFFGRCFLLISGAGLGACGSRKHTSPP